MARAAATTSSSWVDDKSGISFESRGATGVSAIIDAPDDLE
jgi:hypothetical protein